MTRTMAIVLILSLEAALLCCFPLSVCKAEDSRNLSQSRQSSAMRDKWWQEDIDYFKREFPRKQKDCFRLISHDEFNKRVHDLKLTVEELSDDKIILELSRIVASLGVYHARVYFPSDQLVSFPSAFHWYPLQMKWFSDGLLVEAASPEYREVLGARVLRIGSLTPEDALAILSPYISHENKFGLRESSSEFLQIVEVMKQAKLADASGRVKITLSGQNNAVSTIDLGPNTGANSKMIEFGDALHTTCPIFLERPRASYWYKFLTEAEALYIQYNECIDNSDYSFAKFAEELFRFADSHSVKRVIVDLRLNRGGSTEIIGPLLMGLSARPSLCQAGHLYALIGPATWSSGLHAACALSGRCTNACNKGSGLRISKNENNRLHGILLGEPTGEKPNHYGEAGYIKLPHSKLLIQLATKQFKLMPPPDLDFLKPDIIVPQTVGDALRGHDPVLETVLRQNP